MEIGIHDHVALADYLAAPGVSKSGLAAFEQSPARYRYGEPPTTRPQALGRLTHTVVLEPDQVDKRFLVSDLPVFNESHRAYQDEVRRALGRELVKRADMERALRMRDAIMRNREGRELLGVQQNIVFERSFCWIDRKTGVRCRGRADVIRLDLGAMIDIKSARSAGYRRFMADAFEYRYHWQHAMYVDGYELAGGGPMNAFLFLVMEPEPPFLTATYEYAPGAVQAARDTVARHLEAFRQCEATDHWPGYPPGIHRLHLPPRHIRRPSSPMIGSP